MTHTAIRRNRAINWLFRNRDNGSFTIVQMPNIFLWLYIAIALFQIISNPSGTFGTVVSVLSAVVLLIWSGLEILRGVNPFRRILGGIVFVVEALSLIRR